MTTRSEATQAARPLDHKVIRRYATIVADPPWRIDLNRKTPHPAKGSAFGTHVPQLVYPTMRDADIEALRPPAADAAHLYLWAVNAKIEAAYRVARAWGFKPSSLLVWAKNPMGVGLGGTYCNTAEFCLFARRGTLPAKQRIPTTWWNWKRGKHSVKPNAFQEIVESVSPGPYLEMFARRKRDGWDSWGNEVESDILLPYNVELTGRPPGGPERDTPSALRLSAGLGVLGRQGIEHE